MAALELQNAAFAELYVELIRVAYEFRRQVLPGHAEHSEFEPGCTPLRNAHSGAGVRADRDDLEGGAVKRSERTQFKCKILDLRFQAVPDEITPCHSSLGGEFGEGIDVVKDAQHRLRRRERSSRP